MSTGELPPSGPPVSRIQRRSRKSLQDETLHPDDANSLGNSTVDESNKAVVEEPAALQYSDSILYLRGDDKACWVHGETEAEAHALFKEYASVDGVPEPMDGPVPGDRVLRVLADGETRVLLLSPFQEIVRKRQG